MLADTGPPPALVMSRQWSAAMNAVLDKPQTHRVGRIKFEVVAADRTPEADERWSRRSEAITAWLLAEWEREQGRRMAERN